MEAGDEVFFIAASQHIPCSNKSELQRLEKPDASCWWAAAISAGLARASGKRHSVKLIERDQQRAAELAEKLQACVVFWRRFRQELLGGGSILIGRLFIAVTNDDEANILYPRCWRLQAGWVPKVVLIQRRAYVDLACGVALHGYCDFSAARPPSLHY